MSSSSVPPPPNGQVLSLVSALSSPENHELHVQAIVARDQALAASPGSYANLCLQLTFCLIGSDRPDQMIPRMNPADLQAWKQTDAAFVAKLQHHPAQWIPFGQMAGLILKNALLRPPILPDGRVLALQPGDPLTNQVKESLLYALHCQHAELRAVTSSILATAAVSADGVQPALHVQSWPQLIPQLVSFLSAAPNSNNNNTPVVVEGALATIRKIMEDGPSELTATDLDAIVPRLLQFLQVHPWADTYKIAALESLVACLNDGMMPSALVADFDRYLSGLSALTSDPSPAVRQRVCRSLVTLLEMRTEYLQPHLAAVAPFLLASSSSTAHAGQQQQQHYDVALEACEFWLTFASLDESVVTPDMHTTVESLLPQLVPVLLTNMVYSPERRAELLAQNELELQQQSQGQQQQQQPHIIMQPIFHKSRASSKTTVEGHSDAEDGDEDDNNNLADDDDDDNTWTLRKCAAASLDALAGVYGTALLPCLLPSLEQGLSNPDPWIQEAAVLALGAIAVGCHEAMSVHMAQLHPYLLHHLAATAATPGLPQLQSICAWTVGRYATWAVAAVQSGTQGHLLAQMTEIFMRRLSDQSRLVQVACCSAFGVVIEAAGDLMAPYLSGIYEPLVAALLRYQGKSLVLVFDVLATLADCVGPATAEDHLPSIYIPPLLQMWDQIAQQNPANRTLLPLMESLASIALTSGMNFQPYALQSFENAMCSIEMVTLQLAASGDDNSNEEDYDPIICAVDLIDATVEGMGSNFQTLVKSSGRYGQHFLTVLHSLCKHAIAGIRTSALALLGDLARNAPALLEPAIPQLLQEAVASIDPIQPSVCTNAVWATGEIFVRCQGNPGLIEPCVPTLVQNIAGILMGNGVNGDRGSNLPGLVENAAACLGRLAKVNPNFVAADLSRLLLGWCDGMAKITDAVERRDAFEGFVQAVYVNPAAIQRDAIVSILFAVVTWHMPELPDHEPPTSVLTGEYRFRPFPSSEVELGKALAKLIREIMSSVGEETWHSVMKSLPVNVRRLLREAYQV